MKKKQEILITGGCGELGLILSEKLKKLGYQITVMDNRIENSGVELLKLVIPLEIGDVCFNHLEHNYNIIIHLAKHQELPGNEEHNSFPAFNAVNVLGLANMLTNQSYDKFILVSEENTLDNNDKFIKYEKFTKNVQKDMCTTLMEEKDISILEVSNIFSENRKHGFFNKLYNDKLKEIEVNDDLHSISDIQDVAEGIIKILNKKGRVIYSMMSEGDFLTMEEVVRNYKPKLKIVKKPIKKSKTLEPRTILTTNLIKKKILKK